MKIEDIKIVSVEELASAKKYLRQGVKEVHKIHINGNESMLVKSINGGKVRYRVLTYSGEITHASCVVCDKLLPTDCFAVGGTGGLDNKCFPCRYRKNIETRGMDYLLTKRVSTHNKNKTERITKQDLIELLSRTDGCMYCGRSLGEEKRDFHLDHFNPTAKGGRNTTHNMVVCCSYCNLGKKDEDFFEWSKDYFSHNSILTPYQVQKRMVDYFKEYYDIDYSDRINVPAD